jgi:hypothetical protein
VTERYDRFWAQYLGITPAGLNQPGLSIAAHVGLEGYRDLWCFRRRDRTVVSAPPGWIPHLQSRLPEIGQEHLMDALQEGKLLLYQTLETNMASISIARRLGYEQYARHVAVRLRAETPSNPALCNIGS